MKTLRATFIVGGVATLILLVVWIGAGPLVASLSRLAWWQFLLVCLPTGLSLAMGAFGWRYAFAGEPPPYARMLAARITGDGLNVVTAIGSVGGEAVKVWLLRPVVPYDESVPSVVITKTAETIAQTLFLALGLVVVETTGAGDTRIIEPAMFGLIAIEVLAAGGFFLTQYTGLVGRAGRLLARVGLINDPSEADLLDTRLRQFYRHRWPRFLLSVGFHLAGWLIDVAGTLLILFVLNIHAGLIAAVVIEALGSGVRFITFFIPGSLGVLEGANAGTFAILGLGASAGLAFTLVRRARQAVWIGVGILLLVATRAHAAFRGAVADNELRGRRGILGGASG